MCFQEAELSKSEQEETEPHAAQIQLAPTRRNTCQHAPARPTLVFGLPVEGRQSWIKACSHSYS